MQNDISIIGGGLVGSLAALALAQQGYDVTLIATNTLQPLDDIPCLRVSALQPASLALLQDLGVLEKLNNERTADIIAMKVFEKPDESLDFYASEVGRVRLGMILENEMLLQAIRSCYPDTIQMINAECIDIQRCANKGFELSLNDSTSISTGFIVLAQGGQDFLLAEKLGIRFNTFDHQQDALVMHVESTLPHHQVAYQRFLPGGPLAFLPLFHQNWLSIVWSLPHLDAMRMKKLDPAHLAHTLQINFPHLGDLRIMSSIASFPIYAQHADKIAGPDFVLMGDVAHTVHPLAGQGVNLGFHDVAAFIQALAITKSRETGLHHPRLIKEYCRQTTRNNWLLGTGFSLIDYFYKTPQLAGLRRLGSRSLNRFIPLKKQLMKLAMGEHTL